MTVTPAGLITVTARLGDGSLMSAGAVLNGDGTFPCMPGCLFAPRGSIFGTITFRQCGRRSAIATGSVFWFKPAQTILPTTAKQTILPTLFGRLRDQYQSDRLDSTRRRREASAC